MSLDTKALHYAKVREMVRTHHHHMVEEKVAFIVAEYPRTPYTELEDIIMELDVCDNCLQVTLEEFLDESLYYGGNVCLSCREDI